MMRSTFAGFTTAFLGMTASHRALEVTGQNIANVNTEGYTRQRLDITSMNLRSGDFYNNNPNAKIGFGVDIKSVSRIRDPFLDIQYRTQMSKLGTTDAHMSGYEKLADILDETTLSGVRDALKDLNSQLQALHSNASEREYDSMVRSSAQNLLNLSDFQLPVEIALIEHHSHLFPPGFVALLPADLMAHQPCLAAVRHNNSQKRLYGSAFPGAVLPDKADHRTGRNLKADIV